MAGSPPINAEIGLSASASSSAAGKVGDIIVTDNYGSGGLLPKVGSAQAWIPYVVFGLVALGAVFLTFTWLKGKRG